MSKDRRKPCLYDQANIISKVTFWWLNGLFGKTPKAVFAACSEYTAPASDQAAELDSKLERLWKKEIQQYSEGGEANLRKAIFSAFLLRWLLPGLVLFLSEAARIAQPCFLSVVLHHIVEHPAGDSAEVYLWGLGLCCMLFLHAVLSTVYVFLQQHAALKMKTALEALLYRKVVSLSCEAAVVTSPAAVIDQFSTNTDVFSGILEHIHYLWVCPVLLAVLGYLLHKEAGTAGLLCLVLMVFFLLLQAVLETAIAKLGQKVQDWSYQRCQMTGRILSVMMQVKVCCLEMTLTPLVTSLRSQELSSLRVLAVVQCVLWCVLGVCCRLMLLFLVWVAVNTGDAVTTPAVFTSLALLDVLAWCIQHFPLAGVKDWITMQRALATVQSFLLLDEEKEQIKDLRLSRSVSYRNEPYADWVIDIDHMTARWPAVCTGDRRKFLKNRSRGSTSSTKSLLHESDVEHAFSLKYLSLQVKKGELLAVVGPKNCGKTSLLMTLIGELPYEIGQIALNGKVSFCSQEPWLYSGTIRENILFGDAYDVTRYEMAIRACSLTKLLQILPDGDGTLVGKRGLQLSTSYQAKLTLARAIYHTADIYLLDDILHCVDNQTRQDLIKWCVSGSLQSKTRVIVTRSIQLLKAASRIAILREGSLYDIGTYEELQSRGVDIREFVASEQFLNQRRGELEVEEENFRMRLALWKAQKTDNKFEVVVKQSDYGLLFSFLRGRLFMGLLPLLLVLYLGSQALSLSADWILASWTSGNMPEDITTISVLTTSAYVSHTSTILPPFTANGIKNVPGSSTSEYLQLYSILVAASVVTAFSFAIMVSGVVMRASRKCHSRMLEFLMKARIGYFLITSTDSVLSVFSLHLSFIDCCTPWLSYLTAVACLHVVGLVMLVCVIVPWLVIAVLPVLLVLITLLVFTCRMLQGVHSLRDSARQPVKIDVLETLQGLPTIRAFKRQEHFKESFDGHLNLLNWARFLSLCVFSRMMLVCIFLFTLFTSVVIHVSILLAAESNNAHLALCVTYCVNLFLPLQLLLRSAVKLSNNTVSLDEALKLQKVEQEPSWFSDKPPPDNWPNCGSITFNGTSLLAGPEGPYLLRDITTHIKSKEKVGVVGEAGSGKYSLVNALLRIGQVQGMLFMDGFDILKIGLYELRRSISVIPKDPLLFPGTLRSNLDLSGQLSDDELWLTLDKVDLRKKVEGIRGGLHVNVDSDDALLNLGQRQLLCLARAMIRKTKVVIFEEATESIEHELSEKIQRVLRAKFRDCTVITIAHHLSTVMDCDKIMVFHQGEVKEFDTPYNLIKQEGDTPFKRLVERCGRRQAQHLHALAEIAHQQRASASLMMDYAVFMATEQLHASMEDLTFKPGALAWSNMAHFSKSQDSLEKVHNDFGSPRDVQEESGHVAISNFISGPAASMAPSQKLIQKRRMSPARGKKTMSGGKRESDSKEDDKEGMPLLSYDTPPKPASSQRSAGVRTESPRDSETFHTANRDENNGCKDRPRRTHIENSFGENTSQDISSYETSSPAIKEHHKSSSRAHVLTASSSYSKSPNDSTADIKTVERGTLQTTIDSPPAPKRNFSPFPIGASADRAAQVVHQQGRSEAPRERTRGSPRIISGVYSVPVKQDREDPEKIIFC